MGKYLHRVPARQASGTLWCIGLMLGVVSCHDDGITGLNHFESEKAEAAAAIPPAQVPLYRLVSAGYQHSCGITPDSLGYCWGYNGYGQLGSGGTGSSARPAAVSGGLHFRQISAGSTMTCGLNGANRAFCWGRPPVGDGTSGGSYRPTPVRVAGGLRFRQISTGGTNFDHACGLTTDNRAYCWGYNDYGQLGIGSTEWTLAPVPVSGGLQFRQLSTGPVLTCGVTLDDRAYCWGYNGQGGVGDGTTTDRYAPAAVLGGIRFRRVTAGPSHACGETAENLAYCWGDNGSGELGIGSNSGPEQCGVDRVPCSTRPVAVSGGYRFGQVSAGTLYTCARTSLNVAYCWGSGAIGDGIVSGPRLSPVAVSGGVHFRQISAGGDHACAVNPYNRPFCWGRNHLGQVGDGTHTARLSPVRVASPN